MAKDYSKPLYNSAVWKKVIRSTVLARCHYICEIEGCCDVATEVDHIIELTPDNINDPRIAYDYRNLQGLCGRHHKEKTKAEQMKQRHPELEAIMFDEYGQAVLTSPGGGRFCDGA